MMRIEGFRADGHPPRRAGSRPLTRVVPGRILDRAAAPAAVVPDGVTLMGWTTGIRSVLARTGLVAAPLEPHEFESAMHMLYAPPPGASLATVPNIVTPVTSERCGRDGCDRPRSDPIHRLPEA